MNVPKFCFYSFLGGLVLLLVFTNIPSLGIFTELMNGIGFFLFLFSMLFFLAWIFCKAAFEILWREMHWVPISGKINKADVTVRKNAEGGTYKNYKWSIEYMLFGEIRKKTITCSEDALSGNLKSKSEGDEIQLYVNPDDINEVEYKRGLIQKTLMICLLLVFASLFASFLFYSIKELINKIGN